MKKLTIYCFLAVLCSITFYACKKEQSVPAQPVQLKNFSQLPAADSIGVSRGRRYTVKGDTNVYQKKRSPLYQ